MRQLALQYFEAKCASWYEKPDHPALTEGFAGAGGGCAKAEAAGLWDVAGIGFKAATA